MRISEEVKQAIKDNKAVVALESTIISHGMPYPENVKVAKHCEEIVRSNGAVPATIAVINGEIVVGLTEEEIEYIGNGKHKVDKVSRRDLPYVVSQKLNGATTVAATMIIAQMANIKFFATGGIGGVHRNGEKTLDISADLDELSQTSVCVVSSGIKAILDLGRTLEYLETKGVPVIGYQTKSLPAFYSFDSDFDVNFKLDTPKDIASFCKAKWDMGLNGGILVANPVEEKYALDHKYIDSIIDKAILEQEANGIKGKDITPYLLKRLNELTEGVTQNTNQYLVFNNCKVAAMIAKEYYAEK